MKEDPETDLPSVHIVILNWNGLEDTLECLATIRELRYPNVRVHVIDNASKADEATAIAERFPEVNVIALKENLGFCGGCNVGMRAALDEGADFVMLLNNDTLLSETVIEDLLAGSGSLTDIGAVSPVILKYPETDNVWFSKATWESNWRSGETGFRLTTGESLETLKARGTYESEFACGCCLFVSREVIEKIGMFDERYFAFFDEAEWCARMRRSGLRSYVIPSAFMYHKVGRSTPNLVMTYLMTRNRMLWMWDNLSLKGKLRSAPAILKEFVWHIFNRLGLTSPNKRYMSRAQSRVYMYGIRDFIMGNYGNWDNLSKGSLQTERTEDKRQDTLD